MRSGLVDVARAVAAGDRAPRHGLGDRAREARDLGDLLVAHHGRALEAPLVALDLVAVADLDRVGVEHVLGEPRPDDVAVLVHRERGHGGEPGSLVVGDRHPVEVQALEGLGHEAVGRPELGEQLAPRLADRARPRALAPDVHLVAQVAHRDLARGHPAGDDLRRVVGRGVVDDQPLEVAERLRPHGLVGPVQHVAAVVGRGEDREQRRRPVSRSGHRARRARNGATRPRCTRRRATAPGRSRPRRARS